jgi:hypothetical protein
MDALVHNFQRLEAVVIQMRTDATRNKKVKPPTIVSGDKPKQAETDILEFDNGKR